MAMITLRLPDEAKEFIEKEAKFEGKKLSDYIRELIYDKIEDIEDERFIKEYEKNKDKENCISFDESVKELGYEALLSEKAKKELAELDPFVAKKIIKSIEINKKKM